MVFEVNFVWYHPLGTDRTYSIDQDASIRPALLNFLELLHLRRSSILSFDRASLEKAFAEHPELQGGYEQRRQTLLENPRAAGFPVAVHYQHVDRNALDAEVEYLSRQATQTGRPRSDIEFDIIAGEARKYGKGIESSTMVDFLDLTRTVREELTAYPSLLELVKDTAIGYAENMGIFFPQINDIDQERLGEVDWHVWIGRACMGQSTRAQYLNLETCLAPEWDMRPEEIALPVIANGRSVLPVNRAYVAVGHLPQRPKFVRIAFDRPEYAEGTVSSYCAKLSAASWANFLKTVGWADSRNPR